MAAGRTARKVAAIVSVVGACHLSSGPGLAESISVAPGDGHLAAALAAARPGDSLLLAAGVHGGGVTVAEPGLTLSGEAGAIVDAGGVGRAITITAPGVTVRGLTLRNSGADFDRVDAGIFVDRGADGSVIEENRLEGNLFGIYLNGPREAVVRANTIVGGRNARVNERGNGVHVWRSPGTIVDGNDIRFGRDGIFATTSEKNVFRNNRFRDLRFAIHYMYVNDSEISGNFSRDNDVGYALMYSSGLLVRGNVSQSDREHGIMLNYANDSRIEANTIRNGGTKCLFLYNSSKNAIRGNRVEGCEIGIHFTGGSERNTFSENAFIGNRIQVKYVGTRWLEWSSEGRGNYWSDNPAFDLNGDGIADTAYRPNDIVDQILWRRPVAKLLLSSPAVQVLRWAQKRLPALYPGGVVDSAPLMGPADVSPAVGTGAGA